MAAGVMLKLRWLIPLLMTTAGLVGCEDQSTSYMIDGAQHSLTLIRQKPYFWSKAYELSIVVTRLPACQRRHTLKPAPLNDARVELYRSLEGGFIIKQADHYYIAETQQCRLQAYDQPPRELGDALGVFDFAEGKLTFISKAK